MFDTIVVFSLISTDVGIILKKLISYYFIYVILSANSKNSFIVLSDVK